MTATSSRTSPNGRSSSIAGRAFPTRAATRPGSSRSRSGCEVEGKQDEARERTLTRELDWIRASPKARQAKSKARIRAYDELVAEAGTRQDRQGADHHPAGPAPRRRGDRGGSSGRRASATRLLIDDLSFKLPPGGIVGVIGPNGAGKTTLFRMIVGQDKPDDGAIRIGDTVKLGYVDQSRDALDGKKTVFEEISGGNDVIKLGNREVPSRAPMSAGSTSRAPTSRRRSASSRAASGTASISPRC